MPHARTHGFEASTACPPRSERVLLAALFGALAVLTIYIAWTAQPPPGSTEPRWLLRVVIPLFALFLGWCAVASFTQQVRHEGAALVARSWPIQARFALCDLVAIVARPDAPDRTDFDFGARGTIHVSHRWEGAGALIASVRGELAAQPYRAAPTFTDSSGHATIRSSTWAEVSLLGGITASLACLVLLAMRILPRREAWELGAAVVPWFVALAAMPVRGAVGRWRHGVSVVHVSPEGIEVQGRVAPVRWENIAAITDNRLVLAGATNASVDLGALTGSRLAPWVRAWAPPADAMRITAAVRSRTFDSLLAMLTFNTVVLAVIALGHRRWPSATPGDHPNVAEVCCVGYVFAAVALLVVRRRGA